MARKKPSLTETTCDPISIGGKPPHGVARLIPAAISIATGISLSIPWLWPFWGWTTWITFAVIAAVIDHSMPRQAFRRLWLMGFVTHACGFYWLPEVLMRFAGHPAPLAWILCVAFHGLGAVRFGIVGWIVSRFSGRSVLILPCTWTAMELLWPSLFPWRVGQSQLIWPPVVQIAEITGAYGVTFLVVWGGGLIYRGANGLFPRNGRSAAGPPFLWHATAFAVVMVLVLIFGRWRIEQVEKHLADRESFRVAVVQPGTRALLRANMCSEISRDLPKDVQLVVWPETAIGPVSMQFNDFGSEEQLKADGRPPESPLVGPRCYWLVGADSVQLEPEIYFNSAILVGPNQRILSRYHKRQLIPFGEYIPGEHWFPSLRRFSPWDVLFSAGISADPLVMGDEARLGICICYEDLLPSLCRESVFRGADILVNLTNDAWFGDSHALMQHQQLATFRTIENRRCLVRCTTTGSTAIISPTGRVERQAPLNRPAALVVDVKTCQIETFCSRWGDVFGWSCVLLTIGGVLFNRVRTRQIAAV